jgi:acyl-CoA hydrolase
MEPKPVAESQVLLAHWMGPTDANGSGNIHGGTIMKLADEAAGLAAIKHSRTRVTTAGVDRMAFLVPVFVGELVTFKAMVNAAWRTSMEMGVRVEAENPLTGEVRHTNSAYFTFVALDDERRPTPVAAAVAATPTEQRRMREAELRRTNRLDERAEMLARRSEEGDF